MGMARRAATKKAAPKKATAKKTRAKGATAKSPKDVVIPFERAANFAYLPATGALVRSEAAIREIVVTFYIEEMHPISQVAHWKKEEQGVSTYELGDIQEEPRRLMLAAVRMRPDIAVHVANLIYEKVHAIWPDLVPIPKEPGKSQA